MDSEVKPVNSFFYPPDGLLIWIIIMLELFTFGALLITMCVFYKDETTVFHASRLQLNIFYGTINTLFLLVGGYCMIMAVNLAKVNSLQGARLYTIDAIISGLLFLVVKGFEYSEKICSGLVMGVNSFWNFYWMLTLFHVIHLIAGLVILFFLLSGLRKDNQENLIDDFTAGAAFWHMCDLIWLLLFPVLYLVF